MFNYLFLLAYHHRPSPAAAVPTLPRQRLSSGLPLCHPPPVLFGSDRRETRSSPLRMWRRGLTEVDQTNTDNPTIEVGSAGPQKRLLQ